MWRVLLLIVVTAVANRYASAQATEPGSPPSPTVLVLRFITPDDPDASDWIGRAAQEDLATDLTRGTTARIKAPFEAKPVADLDAALKRGREVHATHVVFGQAQSMEGNVRLTGQVLDVDSGRPLGTLKITGPRSSLFDLEDALARQVFASLPQSMLKPDTLKSLEQDPPASVVQLSDPEPEPVRVFPPYASADYSIPERYEGAPAIVINNILPSYDAVVPGYAPPLFGYGPYAYSPFYGSPYGWNVGYANGWYPAFNDPFGWQPYGGVVVVGNPFGFRQGPARHHRNGFGGGRGGFGNRSGESFAGAGQGFGGNGEVGGVGNPVTFQFDFQGGQAFQGVPARGFAPAIPAGGFKVGIPQTGFGNMRGPGFRGPAFGNSIRGGSAVH
ncbi:MAG TPA: hypothetical protein VIM11_22690 [Tepidisphaeraceae bacterium]